MGQKKKMDINQDFKVGDKVRVMDKGLLMLQQFAPPGAKPNNEGYIKEFLEDGDAMIEFPIGDEPMEEHSQVAPYPIGMLRKIN
jgi:hypothetical protein